MKQLKTIALLLLAATVLVYPQTSSVEYQTGTHLEVTTGANIGTDVATINGTFSGGGTINGGPLPVELVSFTGRAEGRRVLLLWETATEVSNFGFDVERKQAKTTEDDDWIHLGFVPGSGNSNSPKQYQFADEDVTPGTWVYRLKQKDNDGSFTYSPEVEIIVGGLPDEFVLEQNYPNPFNPVTTIRFGLPHDAHVRLEVYTVSGEKVATLADGTLSAGYHSVLFDGSSLPSGVYVYRLTGGNYTAVKKLSLIR